LQALFWSSQNNRLTTAKSLFYYYTMQAIETSLEELFKHNPEFLIICQKFGWGNIEIAVKGGKAVMVTVKREIKLS
jgi:hypothetical protein